MVPVSPTRKRGGSTRGSGNPFRTCASRRLACASGSRRTAIGFESPVVVRASRLHMSDFLSAGETPAPQSSRSIPTGRRKKAPAAPTSGTAGAGTARRDRRLGPRALRNRPRPVQTAGDLAKVAARRWLPVSDNPPVTARRCHLAGCYCRRTVCRMTSWTTSFLKLGFPLLPAPGPVRSRAGRTAPPRQRGTARILTPTRAEATVFPAFPPRSVVAVGRRR